MKSAGGALAATASGQPLWRASFVKTVLLLVASAILVSTFFPPAGQLVRGVSSCFHTDPRTIEQRVKRILTDTPLIGICILGLVPLFKLLQLPSSDMCRRPQ